MGRTNSQRGLGGCKFVRSGEATTQAGIHTVFTFDRHFAEQGFEVLPGPDPST